MKPSNAKVRKFLHVIIEGSVQCSTPGLLKHPWSARGGWDFVHPVAPELVRWAVTMSLDRPMLVVIILEFLEGSLQLLDGTEGSDPEQISLQRPTASCLRAAVPEPDLLRYGTSPQLRLLRDQPSFVPS